MYPIISKNTTLEYEIEGIGEKRYSSSIALLIGCGRFEDEKYPSLESVENDLNKLNEILSSKKYGNFDQVFSLKDAKFLEISFEIEKLLSESGKSDFILIYFSGHGQVDVAGKLHLIAADTESNSLETTSISMDFIERCINKSRNNNLVIIIDSAYSGIACRDIKCKNTYIIASSAPFQISKESDGYGLFTKHLIGGILNGKADANNDGFVGIDELYNYVHDQVLLEGPQEPMKSAIMISGDITIACSGKLTREERGIQIRDLLFSYSNGVIPIPIISKSLAIISLNSPQLTKPEQELDSLLSQLLEQTIDINNFIQKWNEIEIETLVQFDVFLCHNTEDKPIIRQISDNLKKRGIRPWLDEEQFQPGTIWQDTLEINIRDIKCAAVFIGPSGLGPWQNREVKAILRNFINSERSVIPVLLEGAPGKPKDLPLFLGEYMWVDFRKEEHDPYENLIWGITGKKQKKE
jgi:hypothetical protein